LEGTVKKSTGSWYYVKGPEENLWACKIKGKFRIKGIRTTNPVAVGDHVVFSPVQEQNREGLITELKPRKNYIIRRATKLSRESHIIAANIDQAIIMVTIAHPKTYSLFIDRFLITAEAYEIPAKIIINKTDLYNEKEKIQLAELKDIYETIGYECIETSVKEKHKLEAVENLLKNKISVISGNSGVGKSTLINYLCPEANLKVMDISDHHKSGQHTTTFAEMIDLSFGGAIIDTPGIKGFGLIDMDKEEIYHFFPEIFEAAQNCKFHNCTHVHEPGCEVKKAVEDKRISKQRYENYLKIFHDSEEKYR